MDVEPSARAYSIQRPARRRNVERYERRRRERERCEGRHGHGAGTVAGLVRGTYDDAVREETHDGAELFGERSRGGRMDGWGFRRGGVPWFRGGRCVIAS